jgi:hypothetical protein
VIAAPIDIERRGSQMRAEEAGVGPGKATKAVEAKKDASRVAQVGHEKLKQRHVVLVYANICAAHIPVHSLRKKGHHLQRAGVCRGRWWRSLRAAGW